MEFLDWKHNNYINNFLKSILANYLGRSHDPLLDILEKGLDDVFIDDLQLDSSFKIGFWWIHGHWRLEHKGKEEYLTLYECLLCQVPGLGFHRVDLIWILRNLWDLYLQHSFTDFKKKLSSENYKNTHKTFPSQSNKHYLLFWCISF